MKNETPSVCVCVQLTPAEAEMLVDVLCFCDVAVSNTLRGKEKDLAWLSQHIREQVAGQLV